MKNPSGKKINNSIYSGIDKKTINLNNDFLKHQLNKILFKKGSGDKDKKLKMKKAKNPKNFYLQNIQTRNNTNSNNDSKYISMKSNNLDTIDKTHNNESKDNNKKGNNFLTQKFNKPNILVFDQGNIIQNEPKIAIVNRAITQPYERNEIIGYKSCGKNNFGKPKNLSLKNNFFK